MSKLKLKLIATPNKTRSDKPLVQLTEDQLEAIAGGARGDDSCPVWSCGGNHNETMVNNSILKEELMFKPKLKLLATPDKTHPDQPLVQLTEDQLKAIAAGGVSHQ